MISDTHLSQIGDRQDALVEFVEAQCGATLVLAGDIFDLWWGWGAKLPSAFVPFVTALAEHTQSGGRVIWIGGNHDFNAGDCLTMNAGVEVVARFEQTVDNVSVLVLHGDEFDRRWLQLALNWVLRGPIGALAMRLLPERTGWRIASYFANRNRESGSYTRERQQELVAQQIVWGDGILAEECDALFFGHTHAPQIIPRPNGVIVNLGDWVQSNTFAVIDENISLYRWDKGGVLLAEVELAAKANL